MTPDITEDDLEFDLLGEIQRVRKTQSILPPTFLGIPLDDEGFSEDSRVTLLDLSQDNLDNEATGKYEVYRE